MTRNAPILLFIYLFDFNIRKPLSFRDSPGLSRFIPAYPVYHPFMTYILPCYNPGEISCISGPKRNQPHICGADFFLESGNVLLSRAVSSQVPSALKGLTSVFGMGTGGTLSPLSPEFCQGLVQSVALLALDSSVANRILRLGSSPHISRLSILLRVP